jgi:quercetin dioxygenase-like cupin family protein
MAMNRDGVLRQAGEGPAVSYLGITATFKLRARESAGGISIVEFTTPPGPAPGPPAHTHPHAETFYVLDGRMVLLVGTQRVEVGAGGFAFAPGGVVHTFANVGSTPARFLTIFTPAGFEAFFEEVARLFQSSTGGPPDMAQVAALAAKYHQVAVGPPLQVT